MFIKVRAVSSGVLPGFLLVLPTKEKEEIRGLNSPPAHLQHSHYRENTPDCWQYGQINAAVVGILCVSSACAFSVALSNG